jgi:predicted TIM-barrel fold metal-dependent hydrolase
MVEEARHRPGGLVIDTHSHWRPPGYVELLLELMGRHPGPAARQSVSIEAARREATRADPETQLALKLADLARADVDLAIVSLPPPGASGDVGIAVQMNDALLGISARSAGRLAVLVSLPLPWVDESLAELNRVARDPHCAGVQVLATTSTRAEAPDAVEQVLARAAELDLPVVLHPAVEWAGECFEDWMLGASLAPVLTSSLAAARLALSGALDRSPSLQLVVPHLGGVLPYLTQRFVDFGAGAAEHDLAHYLRHRIFVDTCSYHPPAMRCAVETMGADRLMLGSDHPARGSVARAISDVRAHIESPDAVLGGTASRVFRLGTLR